MHILIAHGSKYGGTKGLANQIAATLREIGGHTVDVRRGFELDGLGGYDAVIVGGGLYAGRWHRHARRFVMRHVDELRCMPVWMFSSGPLDHSASERDLPPSQSVARLIGLVGARGHATFGGRLTNDVGGFIAKAMVRQGRGGDFRDMKAVEAWAREIAEELTALPVHPTRPAKRSDRLVRLTMVGLEWFTGITAMWGGVEMLRAPQGSELLPIELLAATPFTSFLVPGLCLAGIVGLSNLTSAVLMLRRDRAAERIGFVAGVALTIWIVVEMAMLQAFSWLQGVYLGVGVATAASAAWLGARRWMALRERRSASRTHRGEQHVTCGRDHAWASGFMYMLPLFGASLVACNGDAAEYPSCGVGGDVELTSAYINAYGGVHEYHAVCTVASVDNTDDGVTLNFDCPDNSHPGIVIGTRPAWLPSIVVGDQLDLHIGWLGYIPANSTQCGESWRLASAEDDTLVAAYLDLCSAKGPLDMRMVDGLCEPVSWCDFFDEPVPEDRDVGLEFTIDGKSVLLFAGNWGQLGDYDIWVEHARYDKCDQGDGQPYNRHYEVFVARR